MYCFQNSFMKTFMKNVKFYEKYFCKYFYLKNIFAILSRICYFIYGFEYVWKWAAAWVWLSFVFSIGFEPLHYIRLQPPLARVSFSPRVCFFMFSYVYMFLLTADTGLIFLYPSGTRELRDLKYLVVCSIWRFASHCERWINRRLSFCSVTAAASASTLHSISASLHSTRSPTCWLLLFRKGNGSGSLKAALIRIRIPNCRTLSHGLRLLRCVEASRAAAHVHWWLAASHSLDFTWLIPIAIAISKSKSQLIQVLTTGMRSEQCRSTRLDATPLVRCEAAQSTPTAECNLRAQRSARLRAIGLLLMVNGDCNATCDGLIMCTAYCTVHSRMYVQYCSRRKAKPLTI